MTVATGEGRGDAYSKLNDPGNAGFLSASKFIYPLFINQMVEPQKINETIKK